MLDNLFTEILNFKEYILLCTVTVVIVAILVWLQGREFAFTPRRFKLYRVFITLDRRNTLLFALVASRYIYFITLIAFFKTIGASEILGLLILVVPYEIIARRPRVIIADILASIGIMGATIAFSILYQYLINVYLDIKILALLIILGIFILLYTSYWFVVSLGKLIRMKDERKANEVK